jgi:hypothetical protein
MQSLIIRFALFCSITAASTVVLALPYLTITS